MVIREYRPADLAQLEQIFKRQALGYRFPDLDDRRFFCKRVLEVDGAVRMATLGRATAEVYLLVDPDAGDPRERWEQFQQLHRATETAFLRLGLDDAHCWVPPELVKRFQKRLERLGWQRDDTFTPFCKYLVPDRDPEVVLGA